MPVYRHTITDEEMELSEDYVSAFPSTTFEKIADEGPREKQDRELREAIANKVDVEDDDGNALDLDGDGNLVVVENDDDEDKE